MSRVCELTGKGVMYANKVSHANNKTLTRKLPNLHQKSFFIDKLGASFRFTMCSDALRTVDKHGGIVSALSKMDSSKFSKRVLWLLNRIG